MRHHSNRSKRERESRSRLTKLVHEQDFVMGGLVEMKNTCGKPNCKCAKGQKHESLYLSFRYQGKRKMICIPKSCHAQIRKAVKNYQSLKQHTHVVTEECFNRIISFQDD